MSSQRTATAAAALVGAAFGFLLARSLRHLSHTRRGDSKENEDGGGGVGSNGGSGAAADDRDDEPPIVRSPIYHALAANLHGSRSAWPFADNRVTAK